MAELVAQLQKADVAHQQGSSKGSSHDPHAAPHDSRYLSEQSTNDRYRRHHSRSWSHNYDTLVNKGSIGEDSHDLDSSSHDIKQSDKHIPINIIDPSHNHTVVRRSTSININTNT